MASSTKVPYKVNKNLANLGKSQTTPSTTPSTKVSYNANQNLSSLGGVTSSSINSKNKTQATQNYSTGNSAQDVYMNHGKDTQKVATTNVQASVQHKHDAAKEANEARDALTGKKPVSGNPPKPQRTDDGGGGNTGGGNTGGGNTIVSPVKPETTNTGEGSSSWVQQQLLNLYNNNNSSVDNTPYSNEYYNRMLENSQPKTDEEYARMAEASLMPAYNNSVQAANQSLAQQNLAYDQQLQVLLDTYNRNRSDAEASNAQTLNSLGQNLIRRGMARSTYAGDTEAQTRIQLAQQLQDLATQYGKDVGNVEANRALAATQNAEQLQTLATNLGYQKMEQANQLREADKTNYMNVLSSMGSALDSYNQNQQSMKFQAQQNQQSNTMDLLNMIYTIDKNEQALKKQQQAASRTGSGSGSGTDNTTPQDTTSTTPTYNYSDFQTLLNQMSGKGGFEGSNIYQAAHQYAEAQNEKRVSR